MNDDQHNEAGTLEDEEERISFFPSWNWLYVSIVIYTALLIGLLYLFTVFLDYSTS
jgi:hypothetical protein